MKFGKIKSVLLGSTAFIALACVGGEAFAQHVVTGVVVDASGAPLPGAQVRVPNLGMTTSTNRQGEFTFPSLPAGDARVEVDYLGMPTYTSDLNVSGDARNFVTLTMPLEEIVVTGSIVDSVARALNQQRTADNSTNVVSSDSIGRFPDYNIAEALQRVPGIGVERDQGEGNFISLRGAPSEFTAITIDGVPLAGSWPDTRAVDLGVIPSDAVSGLEVSKTLLPHQEADSIAGSVNLVTRSPFDQPRLRINASGGMSYNEYGGTNDKRGSGVISNVFGADGSLGALFSGSYSHADRRVDNVESVWALVTRPEGDEILGIPEQEFKDYDTRRERIAITGALEFRPGDTSRFFLRGSYARRTDDELRNLLAIVYEEGNLETGATEQLATWDGVRYVKEFRHRILRDTTYTLAGGGEHDFSNFSLDYTLAMAQAEQTYPRRHQLVYRSGGASGRPAATYDFRENPDEPTFSLFQTQEHLNLSSYDFRQATVRSQDTKQDEVSFRTNVTVPGELMGNTAEYRFGGVGRFRDISSDQEGYRDRRASTSPSQSLSALVSDERSQNFGYHLGNKFDSGAVINYFNQTAPTIIAGGLRRPEQSIYTDYEASENIYAVYGMGRVSLTRADIIVGLRVEHTEFEGVAPQFNQAAGTVSDGRASNSYTSLFPNLTVRYAVSGNLIGRFALTRGISRPNYRDNVPRVLENSDGVRPTIDVTRGNPDLRPTLSNNIDIGLERYFEPLGLISASLFYKDLKDYGFTLVRSGQFNGQPALITEKLNADGSILGVELNYQHKLTFLPGLLSNLGMFANYTWTDGKIKLPGQIPGRNASTPLPNQSRDTINLGVFYETGRFNARLAYTDRSDYVDDYNLDARLDTYWEGRGQLDFTSSYDVTERFNIFLEAKNLTNSAGVRYAGVRNRVTEYEKFGYTIFTGLRFNY